VVGGGGELVGQIAQVVLDLPEGLVFGEIDESFGHLTEDGLGVAAELEEEGLQASFAIIRGLGSGRRDCV
jgi:hypothetical protein